MVCGSVAGSRCRAARCAFGQSPSKSISLVAAVGLVAVILRALELLRSVPCVGSVVLIAREHRMFSSNF